MMRQDLILTSIPHAKDLSHGRRHPPWIFMIDRLFQYRPDIQLEIYSLPVLHRVLLGSLTVTNRGGILSRSLHALFEEVD